MSFSPSKRSQRSAGHGTGESEEVELTPMMNVVMMLIPLLMSMAVFTKLAGIEFSLPPATESSGGGGEAAEEPEAANDLDLSVAVTMDGFTITGSAAKLPLIPRLANGAYDFKSLRATLVGIKEKYPAQENVVLVVEGLVLYQDIITCMDICRETQLPNIGLSGGIQ
jgi:biopolymer transport protein ExbD